MSTASEVARMRRILNRKDAKIAKGRACVIQVFFMLSFFACEKDLGLKVKHTGGQGPPEIHFRAHPIDKPPSGFQALRRDFRIEKFPS